jgi:hypothetical protein
MHGGRISSRNASRRVVACCAVALGLEVLAAFMQPYASWIPTLQVGLAAAYVVAIYLTALHRIPKAARSGQSAMNVTGSCLGANHHGCEQHISCPCFCHDNHIKRMMAWPADVVAPDRFRCLPNPERVRHRMV